MTLKIGNLQFAGSLGGLANYDSVSFNFTVTSHTLAVGEVHEWRSNWVLDNTDAISTIQISYAELETVYRYCSGALVLNLGTYEIETLTYYKDDLLHIDTFTVNESGGSVTVPEFIVNVRAFLYNAPF